jgi:hypothetical protein
LNESKKEELKKNNKTTLITPYRKNQKKKNTKTEKQILFRWDDIWLKILSLKLKHIIEHQ